MIINNLRITVENINCVFHSNDRKNKNNMFFSQYSNNYSPYAQYEYMFYQGNQLHIFSGTINASEMGF